MGWKLYLTFVVHVLAVECTATEFPVPMALWTPMVLLVSLTLVLLLKGPPERMELRLVFPGAGKWRLVAFLFV